ncbi:unnamed protein product [Rhizophagus irregularis]|uniref:Uncharacterized protein n=1 Tax=Rhizophagus irregularis TaxID=588596 RepID=A0A916A1Q5_9GLOM|nr:unnamed protein product [Rhizophagus irregularis]CAB5396164.1 unnamed protein product [Rhizophagus irregularis]
MEQVIPHNQRKFEQIFLLKREKVEWYKGVVPIEFFNQVYRHCQYPFLRILLLLIGDFKISIISSEGDNLYEENDLQNCEELYNRLIVITERILKVLKDQQDKGNFRWVKSIEKNFKPIETIMSEIILYKRKRTMP